MPDEPTFSPPAQTDAQTAAILHRANLANLIKRVKAGKPLTAAQMDLIAGKATKADQKRAENEAIAEATKRHCAAWNIRPKTEANMRREGIDLDSDEAVVKWFFALPSRSQGMVSPDFRVKIFEARARLAGGPGADIPMQGAELTDPEVVEFDAGYQPAGEDAKGNLADIRREVAFALFRMKRARARKDASAAADAAKDWRNFSDLLHDCELRAQRLGRDLGESFSAEDVDRLGRAVAYWLLNSADVLIGQLATGLAAASANGPLDREAIRKVVDPLVIGERVLAPMVRASQVNAGVKLPARFVDAMKAGAASVLEDGAVEFGKLYAQDSPLDPLAK